MEIEIVDVSTEDKGKYKQAEVIFKKADGTTGAKKLMSFGGSIATYKVLVNAKKGDRFDVICVKNDKGFWDWTGFAGGEGGAATVPTAKAGTPAPRSTYETPEERAMRQILIVRQSSISSAIAFLALNPKRVPLIEDAVEVAKFFEKYVFGSKNEPEHQEDFSDMKDDVID